MKRPWMPLYVADYLANTGHLTTTEHGAYLLLIMHYWTNNGLPSDEQSIARITRLNPRQWDKSRDVLRSFFGNNWRHKRIDIEIRQAIEISKRRSASAQQMHSKRRANAPDLQTHSHSPSHIQKEDSGSTLSPDFTDSWLKAIGGERDDPTLSGVSYWLEGLVARGVSKQMILSVSAGVMSVKKTIPHRTYFEKAILRSFEESKLPPLTQTNGYKNGKPKSPIMAALDKHIAAAAERSRHEPRENIVGLLPDGRRE